VTVGIIEVPFEAVIEGYEAAAYDSHSTKNRCDIKFRAQVNIETAALLLPICKGLRLLQLVARIPETLEERVTRLEGQVRALGGTP
jgi:hypothetical protein